MTSASYIMAIIEKKSNFALPQGKKVFKPPTSCNANTFIVVLAANLNCFAFLKNAVICGQELVLNNMCNISWLVQYHWY